MKLLAAAAVALVVSGCAFGTNRVKLPPVQVPSAPDNGSIVGVSVKDARGDLSGAEVGFKRNGYGAKTGSVTLANGEQVATRLQHDLVSVLRERGYRAMVAGESAGADALSCNAEVVSFVVDAKQGFWSGSLEGLATVRIEITDEQTGRTVWRDVVRGAYTKNLQVVTEGDHQEVVERMHEALLANLKSALPDGRPPLVKPVALGQ